MTTETPSPKILRQFTWILAVGFSMLLCVIPWWRHGTERFWPLGVSTVLALVGILRPLSLAQPYRQWMRLGEFLGRINSRIVLGLFFFGIITPTALVLKVMRKDLLKLRFDPAARSYRQEARPRTPKEMEAPF